LKETMMCVIDNICRKDDTVSMKLLLKQTLQKLGPWEDQEQEKKVRVYLKQLAPFIVELMNSRNESEIKDEVEYIKTVSVEDRNTTGFSTAIVID